MVGRTRGKAGRGYVDSPWMRQQLRSGQRILPTGRGTRAERQSPRLNFGSTGGTGTVRHRLQPETAESTAQKGTVRKRTNRHIDGNPDSDSNGTHTTKSRASDRPNASRDTNEVRTEGTSTSTTSNVTVPDKFEGEILPNEQTQDAANTLWENSPVQTAGIKLPNPTNDTPPEKYECSEVININVGEHNLINERSKDGSNIIENSHGTSNKTGQVKNGGSTMCKTANEVTNTSNKTGHVKKDGSTMYKPANESSTETSVAAIAEANGRAKDFANTIGENNQVRQDRTHTVTTANDSLGTSDWIDENALMEEIDNLLEPETEPNGSIGTTQRKGGKDHVNGRQIKQEQLDHNSAATKLSFGTEVTTDITEQVDLTAGSHIQVLRKREVIGSTYIPRTARAKQLATDSVLVNKHHKKNKKSKRYFTDVQEFASQVSLPDEEEEWDNSQVPGNTDSIMQGADDTHTYLSTPEQSEASQSPADESTRRQSDKILGDDFNVNGVTMDDAHMEPVNNDENFPSADANEVGNRLTESTQFGNYRTVETNTSSIDHAEPIKQSFKSVTFGTNTIARDNTIRSPFARAHKATASEEQNVEKVPYNRPNYPLQRSGDMNESKLSVIAKSQESIDRQVKLRGRSMIEDKTLLITPVKVEFNIPRETTEFNARKEIILLIQTMKAQDHCIRLKSTLPGGREWKDLEHIPENEEFLEQLQLKEFTYRTHRKVIVHMKIISQQTINRIKYSIRVKDYIFKKNIWIKTDRYNAKVESSPGIITMVHPKLLHREDFSSKLKFSLEQVSPNLEYTLVQDWQKGNSNVTHMEDLSPNVVPDFHLEASLKKWGTIAVDTIRINCAKDDAEYLKYLLSTASEQDLLPQGVFVPAGLHLMEGKEIVKNILIEHSNYITTTVGIPITGISSQTMKHTSNPGEQSVEDALLVSGVIQSIERTRDTEYSGRWIAITTKENETKAINLLTTHLSDIYKNQTGQTRMITVGSGGAIKNNEEPSTVGTYAEILARKFSGASSLNRAPTAARRKESSLPPDLAASTKPHLAKRAHDVESKHDSKSLQSKQHMEGDNLLGVTELLSRLEKLEDTQKTVIQDTKNTMDQYLAQATGQDHKALEDRNKDLLIIENRLEQKIQDATSKGTKQILDTEDRLMQEMNKTMDVKIKALSNTAATQVAAQLMDIMHQYMRGGLPANQMVGGRKETPLITQEGGTSTDRDDANCNELKNTTYPPEQNTNLHMLEALNNIDASSLPLTGSPHDNTNESILDQG